MGMSTTRPFYWKARPFFVPTTPGIWVAAKGGIAVWGETRIRIKSGWCTDLTSTPKWLEWLVPPDGSHAYAAALHDVALERDWPRDTARGLMVAALLHDRDTVHWTRRVLMTAGVWAYDRWKCSRMY